jgi:hypothetical protein
MQNPNMFKRPDGNGEEEKYDMGLVSLIDNDYVLNFLNDLGGQGR